MKSRTLISVFQSPDWNPCHGEVSFSGTSLITAPLILFLLIYCCGSQQADEKAAVIPSAWACGPPKDVKRPVIPIPHAGEESASDPLLAKADRSLRPHDVFFSSLLSMPCLRFMTSRLLSTILGLRRVAPAIHGRVTKREQESRLDPI